MCHNVNVEPALQPLTGEVLSGASAIKDDAARLDIAADGFWGDHRERVYSNCDVRIFNPLAPSNNQSMSTCYRKHEKMKKRAYEQRIREVEHGSFTPLVFSATGGMGDAAKIFYKRLVSMIAEKSGSPYSTTLVWLRTRLSFSLLYAQQSSVFGGLGPQEGVLVVVNFLLVWNLLQWRPDCELLSIYTLFLLLNPLSLIFALSFTNYPCSVKKNIYDL